VSGSLWVVETLHGNVSTWSIDLAAPLAFGRPAAIGVLIVVLVLAFALFTVRWTLMHSPRFVQVSCPVCGGPLHRIHRRRADRILSLFIPVKRFQCKDHQCGWSGLRVSTSRVRSRRRV